MSRLNARLKPEANAPTLKDRLNPNFNRKEYLASTSAIQNRLKRFNSTNLTNVNTAENCPDKNSNVSIDRVCTSQDINNDNADISKSSGEYKLLLNRAKANATEKERIGFINSIKNQKQEDFIDNDVYGDNAKVVLKSLDNPGIYKRNKKTFSDYKPTVNESGVDTPNSLEDCERRAQDELKVDDSFPYLTDLEKANEDSAGKIYNAHLVEDSFNDETSSESESDSDNLSEITEMFSKMGVGSVLTEELQSYETQNESVKNESEDIEEVPFSEKILKMMQKMGHTKGEGLGQNKQGVTEPIELKGNLGFRGLGHEIKGLEPAKLKWNSEQEDIQVRESISWLEFDNEKDCKYFDDLSNWIKISTKKLSIEDETHYCNPELIEKVLKAKEVFDELDIMELCRARSRANPFETIRSAFFMNRAALKMANIDAITGFMFSNVDRQEEHKQSKTPYYFADICAGPGGFSEYIFWRKKWAFKGYGLTLKGEHDFRLHESTCAPFETFEALYGVYDDGDIYPLENIVDFCTKVKNETNGGVHFIMADGGFSVEGQENIQEILSKRLYVCQCCTALNSLRPNGHFLTKLFDLFTPFSVGLIFLMYHCFERITIIKPNSSRPANSERYLICSKLKTNKNVDKIRKYLKKIVQVLWDLDNDQEKCNLDIYEIVPEKLIKNDNNFLTYITESNNRLAEKQIIGLEKLATFCRDPTLFEPKQDELRKQCLEFWQVPNKNRSPLPHLTPRDVLPPNIFNNNFETQMLDSFEPLGDIIREPSSWHCAFLGNHLKNNHCEVFVGVKNNVVYRSYLNKWVKVKNVRLVRGTILFAELIKEYKNSESYIYKKYLHVIDALKLGDTSLADLPFQERRELIDVYCQAVNCPSRRDLVGLKMKKIYNLSEEIDIQMEQGEWLMSASDKNKSCYSTNSILFIQTDSSQNFHSILSNPIVVRLPEEINDLNTINLRNNLRNLYKKINHDNT